MMWGEAMRVAAYLTNRSQTATLDKTPYEYWMGREPDLCNIKVFGCEAHAKILGTLRKLGDPSKRLTMIGYAQNGYRLWDSKNKMITVHRDVVFEENVYQEMPPRMNMSEMTYEDEDNKEDDATSQMTSEESIGSNEEKTTNEEEEAAQNSIQSRRSERENKGKMPEKYKDFAFLTYKEAIKVEDSPRWIEALEEEK